MQYMHVSDISNYIMLKEQHGSCQILNDVVLLVNAKE